MKGKRVLDDLKMIWTKIDSPEEIADCDNSRVLFTLPCSFDHIENWVELGRTGAMLCCFRPNIRKRWTSFGMSCLGTGYGLDLDADGLRRMISSVVRDVVKQGVLQGMTEIQLMHRKVSCGDFNDFKQMGEYAVKRFPFIATDLTDGIEKILSASMFYSIETEKIAKQLRGDWEFYQKRVSEAFYNMFCESVLSRNDFAAGQASELVKLVSPLKLEAVDNRYSNMVLYNPEEP